MIQHRLFRDEQRMKHFGAALLAAGVLLTAARPSPALAGDGPSPRSSAAPALRASAASVGAEEPARGEQPAGAGEPRGMTMRIQQEYLLGSYSASGDYRACFLPPDRFRVQGIKRLEQLQFDVQVTVASDGRLVRQIEKLGEKTTGHVVDLDRVRKELPWADYSPAKTYDPSVYADMLKDAKEKKTLPPEDLDGAPAEGFELALSQGRLSLPFNVSIVLPDPAKVRFWINPKDGIARKVELEDDQGRVFLRTLYTDVRTDAQVNPELFELEFPKDVTPGDITNIVIRGVEATRSPPGPPAQPKPEMGK
jgi:outer membrane lipoprotein-sorting protein